MGRFGGAILTIVGTVVGSYFGFPALGTVLGGLAGQLLFPVQLPAVNVPRLQDLQQTTSTVGASIPRGWGTYPAAGAVIAQTDLREVIESQEVGGKGAPTQTVNTPTYYQDFAIGLNDGAIGGIRVIWANGKAIYDRRPQRDDENDTEFQARIAASDKLDQEMVIYLGTEVQDPDPTLEAFYGVGEISAFRGLAYVVFINWKNKAEDGNRLPANWRFEVFDDAVFHAGSATAYSTEELHPWLNSSNPLNPLNTHHCTVTSSGDGGLPIGGSFDTVAEALATIEAVRGKGFPVYMGYALAVSPGDAFPSVVPVSCGGPTVADHDKVTIGLHFNVSDPLLGFQPAGIGNPSPNGQLYGDMAAYGMEIDQTVYSNQNFVVPGYGGIFLGVPTDAPLDSPLPNPLYDFGVVGVPGAYALYCSRDAIVTAERVPRAPSDPCLTPGATPIPELPGYAVLNGDLLRCIAWTRDDSQNYRVLQQYSAGGALTGVEAYPLNPARPIGHADDNPTFWQAAYAEAVAAGNMVPGLVYNIGYPSLIDHGYYQTTTQQTIDTGAADLADIVSDLCLEAGLTAPDFDVTDLAGVPVMGYVRTKVMPARSAIDPLRQAFFFDGVESNFKIKFVRRGKAVVATITDDELGVAVAGETPPSRITTAKAQDVELPASVRVHYLSRSRDYEAGAQSSPVRLETGAVNDTDVELPMVLSDDQAAQIAQILWADAWAGRWQHKIVLDQSRHALEPTDCLGIPVDGRVERARVVSVADSLPATRTFDLMRDDDGAWVSYAVASVPPFVPPAIGFTGPVEFILLDLPTLRDQDNDAGFYSGCRPLLGTAFAGAALYRSVDGGANFAQWSQFASMCPIGVLEADVDSGPSTVFDEATTIRVRMQSGALESRTEAAVLAGANAAAIGAHGRWEIIQFKDATAAGGDVYELTGLLRGRRGTEHNIGTSLADDRFVMLSAGGLVRVAMELARVGSALSYRAVAASGNLAAALTQVFTGAGESLIPLSVVHLEGTRAGANISVTWVRRGRLGQELPSGADIPLSEEAEAYAVDLLDSSGTVLETHAVTVQAFAGVAPVNPVRVQVFQISASVGRGHVAEVSV